MLSPSPLYLDFAKWYRFLKLEQIRYNKVSGGWRECRWPQRGYGRPVKADVTTSAQTTADQAKTDADKADANLTDAQAAAKTAVDANSNAAIFVGILSILSSASLLFFLFGKRKKN